MTFRLAFMCKAASTKPNIVAGPSLVKPQRMFPKVTERLDLHCSIRRVCGEMQVNGELKPVNAVLVYLGVVGQVRMLVRSWLISGWIVASLIP